MMRWLALLALLLAPSLAHAQATVVSSCGTASYTAGTPHNVTIDVNGQSCQVGGGSGATVPTSVWSAADAAANGMVLSNGGLTLTVPASLPQTFQAVRTSISKTSGKLYLEWKAGAEINSNYHIGVASAGIDITTYLGNSNFSFGNSPPAGAMFTSTGFSPGSGSGGLNVSVTTNDVLAMAVDFATGKVWMAYNNVWANSGNPTAGTGQLQTFTPATVGALFAAMTLINGAPGVWTLQPTAASQKYAPPTGFTAWDAAAAPGCSQATAYLARATGETAHASDLTTLICGLVTDGVWAKLDALYVLAQQTQADALLNLVGTNYGLVIGGSGVTFTSYTGFSFTASIGYLDTGFNSTTAISPRYTQNSASFGYWSYATASESSAEIGSGATSLIYGNYSGTFYARINNAGGGGVPLSITKGLLAGDRTDASNVYPYQNGVASGPMGSASGVNDNANFLIGFVPGSRLLATVEPKATNQTISAAFIGGSLGSAGQLALYNRLRTYLTSVGVP